MLIIKAEYNQENDQSRFLSKLSDNPQIRIKWCYLLSGLVERVYEVIGFCCNWFDFQDALKQRETF